MKTEYLEIESIILTGDAVTIAATVMLKGLNYPESAYTNIFCDRSSLMRLMQAEPSSISKLEIEQSADEVIQIDSEDSDGKKPGKPGFTLTLEPVDSSPYGFACYDLMSFEMN